MSPPLSKCRILKISYKISDLVSFSPLPSRPPQKNHGFLGSFPLCKSQPGLNAGGPNGTRHIAPFLPLLSNHNATDSEDKA